MMSVERSFDAWEEVQRHGQDLADRLTQGFTGLIQSHITPPSFSWPNTQKPKLFEVEFPPQNFVVRDFRRAVGNSSINGVSAIFDIGNRIGQAGVDFGACINGMVHQFFRRIPVPFQHEETAGISLGMEVNSQSNGMGIALQEDLGLLAERFRVYGFSEIEKVSDESVDEATSEFNMKASKLFGRSQVKSKNPLFSVCLLCRLLIHLAIESIFGLH